MAVVQISKIQVRRGQKNSNSGIPQLSSAEFAWAVDSQELYIGNGSVLEGAPYVGNTKILTEHDNILELASSYQFASDDPSITLSVPRPLQSKLDEYVSVTDFGAVGDGSTDCVLAFETAFTQLFRNVNENYRKVLLIPNGEYLFTSGLAIPSGVILQGETQSGAILNIGSNNIRFITSAGLEIANFNSSNRPSNIQISNITIQSVLGQFVLSGVADSTFTNIKFKANYVLGDPYEVIPAVEIQSITDNVCTTTGDHSLVVGDKFIPRTTSNGLSAGVTHYIRSTPSSRTFTLAVSNEGPIATLTNGGTTIIPPATTPTLLSIIGDVVSNIINSLAVQPATVTWNNSFAGYKVDNITFNQCSFESTCIAVKCVQTGLFDTNIKFQNCKFFVNDTSIYIQGLPSQGNNWQIVDCDFEEITKQAFRSTNGIGTKILRTKFKNVGNGTNIASDPEDFMVYFGQKNNNILAGCISDRQQSVGSFSTLSTAAYSEVYNSTGVSFIDKNYSSIVLSDSFRPLAVFSVLNKFTIINYCLKLGEHTRYGTLNILIGDDLSMASHGSDVAITDSYTYSPRFLTTAGGALMTNFEFNIAKTSNTTGDDSTSSVADTLVLSYKNPLATGALGNISFDVAYGV